MTNAYPAGSPGISDSSMPIGAPGFAARRSSYASVVSGTASAISLPYQPPSRSGALSHLLNQSSAFGYDLNHYNTGGHPRYDSRSYDMDFGANGASHGRSGSWGRNGHLPSYSSAYGPIMSGSGDNGYGGSHGDTFFVPSYLRGSKYVQKLEECHKAKLLAYKDGPSSQSSQPGSLSTSASSTHLHAKVPPSHRGMTYDLIEKAPPLEDETLSPLPSKWNNQDKFGGLEVMSDGQEVKFTGPKPDRDRDHEACAIRADHSMPPQCGIYYFEVTIISRKREE
jgi:Ran-binding protein 9/10